MGAEQSDYGRKFRRKHGAQICRNECFGVQEKLKCSVAMEKDEEVGTSIIWFAE